MVKYDERGNVIERTVGGMNAGLKIWFEYDDKDQVIYEKNSSGYEAWWEYDDRGRRTSYKNTTGADCKWSYDDELNSIDGMYFHKENLIEDVHGPLGGLS